MKARAFALMTTAFLLCAAALYGSAQDIDNCCFIDRQCLSDQDWVDGYWAFQNNQCSAPAAAQSQPAGGAPAQIDNCCFVDRQCSSDQDWINGYWAFQNNQCNAPSQSPAVPSSQPAGGVLLRTASGVVIGYPRGRGILPSTASYIMAGPGQIRTIDNCCDVTWQCDTDQDWAAGYHAFQINYYEQCALPGVISIVGDPDFVHRYERALNLLKNKLPQRFDYVLDGLDKIEKHAEAADHPDLLSRVLFLNRSSGWANWDFPVERLSGLIVHEACHVHRYDAGYRQRACNHEDWTAEEVICRGMSLETVIALDAPADVIESTRAMVERTRSGGEGLRFMANHPNC